MAVNVLGYAPLDQNEAGMTEVSKLLGDVYNEMDGCDLMTSYSERHGIASAAVLTVTDDETASALAERLSPRVAGKVVVEIGGGIGLLALHLGSYAKRVYCIEANPMWSTGFAAVLLKNKPRNVSYLFGSADEFIGAIKGDLAIYCTHSDVRGMGLVAAQFAPTVIDVYGEMIEANPKAFDATASALRAMT